MKADVANSAASAFWLGAAFPPGSPDFVLIIFQIIFEFYDLKF